MSKGKHVAERRKLPKYKPYKIWGKKFLTTVASVFGVFFLSIGIANAIPTDPTVPEYYPKDHYQVLFVAEDVKVSKVYRDPIKAIYTPPANIATYAALAETYINDVTKSVQFPFKVGVPLSDGFGPRTKVCEQEGCETTEFHEGLDFVPGEGAEIQAIADGIVTEIFIWNKNNIGTEDPTLHSAGTYVRIQHNIDGQTVISTYAHLQSDSIPLKEGDKVRVGYIVGKVGNTGLSTGPHLHLGINVDGKNVDPMIYLSEKNRTSAPFPNQ